MSGTGSDDSQLADLLHLLMMEGDASATTTAAAASPSSNSNNSSTQSPSITVGIQTDVPSADFDTPLWILSLPVRAKPQQPHSRNQQPLPPASKPEFPLYRDLLQIVFRYLTVTELVTASRLSKVWFQALSNSPPLGINSTLDAADFTRMPAHTVIARHIGSATYLKTAIEMSQNLHHPGFNLLHHLSMLLPNLTSLSIPRLPLNDEILDQNWSLPPLLRCLEVQVELVEWCARYFPKIGQLLHLQELTLLVQTHIETPAFNNIDFSPLFPLSQLQIVNIGTLGATYQGQTSSNPSFAQLVRRNPIRTLKLATAPTEMFYHQLFDINPNDPPSPLMSSLTSFTVKSDGLTRLLLRSLINYSNLTHMSLPFINLDGNDVKLLANLPKMTKLTINNVVHSSSNFQSKSTSLVAACRFLPNLQKLCVRNFPLTVKEIDTCLSFLPHLTDLELFGANATTFAPLAKYGLPQRLVRLVLKHFLVPYEEFVQYILSLQHLEKLHLLQVCTTKLAVEWRERMKIAIPSLKDYEQVDHSNARPYETPLEKPKRLYEFDPNQRGTRGKLWSPYIEQRVEKNPNTLENVTIRDVYFSICAMPNYEHKTLEELRFEDEEIGLDAPVVPPVPNNNPPATFSLQQTSHLFTQPASGPFSLGPASAAINNNPSGGPTLQSATTGSTFSTPAFTFSAPPATKNPFVSFAPSSSSGGVSGSTQPFSASRGTPVGSNLFGSTFSASPCGVEATNANVASSFTFGAPDASAATSGTGFSFQPATTAPTLSANSASTTPTRYTST